MRKKKSRQKKNSGKNLEEIIRQENVILKKILKLHSKKKTVKQSIDKKGKQNA